MRVIKPRQYLNLFHQFITIHLGLSKKLDRAILPSLANKSVQNFTECPFAKELNRFVDFAEFRSEYVWDLVIHFLYD
jgi:hypothetical protein